mmetsp:Transcript_3852/g.8296  ORF Transcript_3852/g.8296 Transcript_3852/m.8296 type:complete len:100 (+) Transcript_3852:414-713(+)|eukprot:CAMPEP_0171518500 /NCGR_PEP_ID=MMETSP0959-20130129/5307_1 /TAXON_ID=87120 /ORGANISM="Aurantiochytrium limacinum, Strain ATCCMYA-1381" /LENGTH=99 /DNA_ID=CAMNT_0012057689 /DNA_START=353 /DNA_END=652 /DNA_ORIENTATION=-
MSGGRSQALWDIPCARESTYLGIASGVVMAGHRFYGTRSTLSAVDWGIKMLCVVSVISFAGCRYDYHIKRNQMLESIKLMNERQSRLQERRYKPEEESE